MGSIKMKLLVSILISFSFKLNAQNWYQVEKQVAYDRQALSEYGNTVSIYDSIAIVGAYLEDKDTLGSNSVSNSGAAYIYRLNTSGNWIFTQKTISANREVGGRYGSSVCVYGDYLVVGAVQENLDETGGNSLNDAGAAYIYKRNSNGYWSLVQKIVASDRSPSDYFGFSVRIFENTIVVGAFGNSTNATGSNIVIEAGAAYIFERDTVSGIWSETQKIVASDRGQNDWYGYSVCVSGNTIVVGAYQNNFDASGGNNISNSGSAFIYEKNLSTGVWSQTQKITASVRYAEDLFGGIVCIDGDNLVVGAKSHDFDVNEQNAVPGAGAAYFFQRNTQGVWQFKQKMVAPIRNALDYFGNYVGIHKNYVVISAPKEDEDEFELNTITNAGAFYVYEIDGTGLLHLKNKLVASDREANDELFVVEIYNNNIISGTPNERHDINGNNAMQDAGSVYFFRNNCPTILQNNAYSICQGDSLFLAGSYQFSSGYYVDSLASTSCSDSLVYNYLTVLPTQFSNVASTICLGDSIYLQGAYQNSAGIYIDTLISVSGCDSIRTTNLSLKNIYNVYQSLTICSGDSIFLAGNYQFNSGNYVDTLSSTACYDSLMNTTLIVNSVNTSVSVSGINLTSNSPGNIYQWLDCNSGMAIISGATGISFTPVANGSYALLITDNGCSDTSSCYTISTVGLVQNNALSDIIIFPNPNNGQFSVLFDQAYPDVTVTIRNNLGSVLFKQGYSAVEEVIMDVDLPKGIYFIEININDVSRISKSIILN